MSDHQDSVNEEQKIIGHPLFDRSRLRSLPSLLIQYMGCGWSVGQATSDAGSKEELKMSENVSILDGSTFLVSDPNGDIDAKPDHPQGLFFRDMRHLSKWKLTINGIALDALTTDTIEYYFAQHFCARPTGTIYKNTTVSVIRRRFVGDGF